LKQIAKGKGQVSPNNKQDGIRPRLKHGQVLSIHDNNAGESEVNGSSEEDGRNRYAYQIPNGVVIG
jgi:hypothetical protein